MGPGYRRGDNRCIAKYKGVVKAPGVSSTCRSTSSVSRPIDRFEALRSCAGSVVWCEALRLLVDIGEVIIPAVSTTSRIAFQ